ncbi:MAG: Gfo/Idh/MocA family oxidoreductase [Ruminococcus sp.]|nr:Gfo/Idh/MocA family oxidoreductase [Ruminococcus sp.]
MKKYRWGIIGTGRIAHSFAEALKGVENASLYAVGSRNLQKAEDFANKHGFEKSYGSYAELAADPDIDIVYIATPMASHYADSMLCINSGRNVLCEKSLALNTAQAEEMINTARNKGVFFMEAMWMKCRPVYRKAMEWLSSGKIGKVHYVKADLCTFTPYNKNDRLFAPECGGGALLDLGVYPITFAADIFGDTPEEIISFANISRDVDISNSVTLKYKNGVAVLQSGFELLDSNRALISGENGSIVFDEWFHCTSGVTLYDSFGKEIERADIPPIVNGYEYEIMEAQNCLSNGLIESSIIPHSSTLAVMKIMDKCRQSWGLYYPEEKYAE